MCYGGGCNPRCGKCTPKKIVEVECPLCSTLNSMSREEYLLYFDLPHRKNVLEKKMQERGEPHTPLCRQCGQDLSDVFKTAVKPEVCNAFQVICGYPCGRRDEEHKKNAQPCKWMVPVGKINKTS